MQRDGPGIPHFEGQHVASNRHFGGSISPPKKAPASQLISTPKPSSVTGNKRVKKPAGKAAKKPPKSSGYFWRKDGAGWELRKDIYVTGNDGEKKRKQPYVSHLGREEFASLKRTHKGKSLDAAIADWIRSHDR